MDNPASIRRPRPPAFTLVELLVSIGIIAVLLALALPALSGARKRARDAAGLSNLHQTGLVMETYTQRYGGWLPWAPEGTEFGTTPSIPPTSTVSSIYWDLSTYWSSLFLEVAPWEDWFGLWCFPDPRRSTEHPWQHDPGEESPFGNGVTSLRYSRALFADPELWQPGPMIEHRDSVMRAVRLSEVRYTSGKVILYDAELGARERLDDPLAAKRAMLFVDAHAAMKALGDAIAPAPPRLPWFEGHASPVLDTAGGAYGRDYQ